MSMGRFSPKNLAATLCVVGFCAILSGILFTVKDWDVSEIAIPVELADLEAGHPIPNRHLSIGEHTAIYEKPLVGSSGQRQKLEFVIYPIVSKTELVSPDPFRVLVHTRRFDTLSRIPKRAMKKDRVVGMVAAEGLDSKYEKLLSKQYPKVDFSNVIVLHEGQKRVPDSTKLCLFIGGLAALILGVVALLQY